MTLRGTEGEPGAPHAQLRGRCEAIGAPTWRYALDGTCLEQPAASHPTVRALLGSDALRRVLDDAVKRWSAESAPGLLRAADGCWLLPLVETRRRRRHCVTIVLLLGEEGLRCAPILEACRELNCELEDISRYLEPIAFHNEGSARTVARMLCWAHGDLHAIESNALAVDLFGRQLSDSYEEISLLYKIGRAMSEIAQPRRFVQVVCDELLATLNYGWIAAQFAGEFRATRLISGRTCFAGDPPVRSVALTAAISEILCSVESADGFVLEDDLPAGLDRGGRHVLVHPIMGDEGPLGVLVAGDKRGHDVTASGIDMKMLEAAAGHTSIVLGNANLYDDQQAMFLGTIEALISAIDAKDPYTRGHSQRVAYLAQQLAIACGVPRTEAERIRVAGLVHDIGKIGVPEHVLRKTGRLTEDEYELIKLHPEIGHHILRDIPLLGDVLPGVLSHHERCDGKGYPHGLKADEIPLMARIIGLVDAFDAMSSNRTYRPAMPRTRVLEEIAEGAGGQFDPMLARRFLEIDLSGFDRLLEEHHAEDARSESLGSSRRSEAA